MAYDRSRRAFLRTSGVVAGAGALAALVPAGPADASGGAGLVVRAMLATLATGAADAASLFFSTNATYLNVPFPPAVVGRANIRAGFEINASLVDDSTINILQQVVQDGLVMNQRIDTYRFISDGTVINLPVMGIFTVAGGLITSWADYFDLGQSGLLSN